MNRTAGCILEGVEDTGISLGEGGYATVFLGEWEDKKVAIKRLHPALMGLDCHHKPTKQFTRFIEEFSLLRRLFHPCIVQVYGLSKPSSRAGSYGIVMELLPMSLKERYSQEPALTTEEEIGILVSVSSAVEYLHSNDILHRDITSSNVMCTNTGVGADRVFAKLVDLSVARALDMDSADDISL